MQYAKLLTASVLLFTTPSFIASPLHGMQVAHIAIPDDPGNLGQCAAPNDPFFSYDDVVELLAKIESGDVEEFCSAEQMDRVNQFIAFLAKQGIPEDPIQELALNRDIENLLYSHANPYAYLLDQEYSIVPSVFYGEANAAFCKSWLKKQWDQTREFVKKHKKAIIIGAIVVVAVTVVVVTAVVISASAASAAAGGIAAASAGALDSGSSPPHQKDHNYLEPSHLTSSLQEEIVTFKENVAQEQLAAISDSSGISMEENGRIIGSLFTHKTIDTLSNQIAEKPWLGSELQNLGLNSPYPPPKWASTPTLSPHTSTDLAFSTNYSLIYTGNNSDLNTLTYQARGDWALSSGCYTQALQDFGKAIEIEPNNPNSYLGRGIANFELGHYQESIADYNNYVSQAKESFSVTDFSIGFAKGLPHGIYDSGEGMLLFVTELACHPIQTGEKVYDSLSTLSNLTKSGEWNLIGEALSPELHQLISEWDTLSSRKKGELSGYAFGKLGADILLPGATAKAVAKGSVIAKELGAICKNLESAEKLLVLEAVAEGGAAGINVREVVISARRTLGAGEELGLTTKEIATLKQSGELEQVIGKGRDFFVGNPELQASYDLFKKAQESLGPYRKTFMPEQQIRELIHQTGIPTFQRPAGIPENFKVRLSKKGAGIEYVDPQKKGRSIRVMPGVPHSPNPAQKKPYVVQTFENMAIDKNGNIIHPSYPEAHIPLDEFVYKG